MHLKDEIKLSVHEMEAAIIAHVGFIDQVSRVGPVTHAMFPRPEDLSQRSAVRTPGWQEGYSWVLGTKDFAMKHHEDNLSPDMESGMFEEAAFRRSLFADRYTNQYPVPIDVLASMKDVERKCRWFKDQNLFKRDLEGLKPRWP